MLNSYWLTNVTYSPKSRHIKWTPSMHTSQRLPSPVLAKSHLPTTRRLNLPRVRLSFRASPHSLFRPLPDSRPEKPFAVSRPLHSGRVWDGLNLRVDLALNEKQNKKILKKWKQAVNSPQYGYRLWFRFGYLSLYIYVCMYV